MKRFRKAKETISQTPRLGSRVRFVLCRPAHPGNIGMAARAIKTMGFRDLRVVAPREPDFKEWESAQNFATSSVDVLQAARVHDTLEQALVGVSKAWALTGYDHEFGPEMVGLRRATKRSQAWLRQCDGDIAFVFGCRRSGLTNEEVLLCHGQAAIAADPESSSLNLAQAVQVVAYEMHMAGLDAAGHEGKLYDWQERFAHERVASVEDMEGFYAHWEKAMIACGVHNPEKPKNLMAITRRLFSRSGLTRTEIDLLRGVCSAIICPKREREGRKKKLDTKKD